MLEFTAYDKKKSEHFDVFKSNLNFFYFAASRPSHRL